MSSLVTPPPKLVTVSSMEEPGSKTPSPAHSGLETSGEAVVEFATRANADPSVPSKTAKIPSTQRPITSQAPRAPAGSHLAAYSAFSLTDSPGLRAPQNTPADYAPVAAIRPSQAATPGANVTTHQGGGETHRPILFNSIISRGVAHAITPGNTPSSLERVTKRIGGNLLAEGPNGQNNGAVLGTYGARIAPSYERRFVAGLNDLDNKFAQAHKTKRQPPPPQLAGEAAGKEGDGSTTSPAQWPQAFAASVKDAPVPAASVVTQTKQ